MISYQALKENKSFYCLWRKLMKKIFFLFFVVAALFFGCRNEVSDSSNELKMTLMQRIAIAENGDEIDLEKEDFCLSGRILLM